MRPKNNKRNFWKIIGGVVGLVTIVTLIIALAQLFQSLTDARSTGIAQSTELALFQKEVEIQQEILTLVSISGIGPTATANAKRVIELESTRAALATEQARVKQFSSKDLTLKVQANLMWQNTGITIDSGETVDIKYVSGQWRGVRNGYWSDGTNCDGSFADGIVPDASGTALVVQVGSGTPKCVNNSPFVSSNSGVLYLSYNDCPEPGCFSDNEGSIKVHIKVFR